MYTSTLKPLPACPLFKAIASLFMGRLYSKHHDCGFKVSCTPFMYTSTLKPLPACPLFKAVDDLMMGAMARVCGR